MNSRQIREVQVADEVEAGVVNQLIGAYQVLFTAADLVDIAIVGKDHLRTSLRRAEFAVAGHNVQLAKRHLCKQVALSRRRGELIALAGHLADIGSSVAPEGAPAEDEEPGDGPICPDCLNKFPNEPAFHEHALRCPVAEIRDLAAEAKQLEISADSEGDVVLCGADEPPCY